MTAPPKPTNRLEPPPYKRARLTDFGRTPFGPIPEAVANFVADAKAAPKERVRVACAPALLPVNESGEPCPIYRTVMRLKNGLFLAGPPGTGKTHMACAVVNALSERLQDRFFDVPQLVDDARAATAQEHRDLYDSIRRAQQTDLVILDDLSGFRETDFAVDEVRSLIRRRLSDPDVGPTIITSNTNRQDTTRRLGESLASRLFAACAYVEIRGSDKRAA